MMRNNSDEIGLDHVYLYGSDSILSLFMSRIFRTNKILKKFI